MSSSDDDEYGYEEDVYPELEANTKFDLFEVIGGSAQTHGSLKSFETQKGTLIYSEDKSDFLISAERLLQADGYANADKKEMMTLFVLKIICACNSESRVKQISINMKFQDIPRRSKDKTAGGGGVKPYIVAWAPFDDLVKRNPIEVKTADETSTSKEASGQVGAHALVTGKLTKGSKRTLEWTQRYWETAHSFPFAWDQDEKRVGVRWVLNANPNDSQGLSPTLLVGILLSRQSDEPFLVSFNIAVKGGLLRSLKNGIETLLGLKPGVTTPYKVTPSEDPQWFERGRHMLEKVDLNNMSGLQGEGNKLCLVWDEEDDKAAGVSE